MLSAFEQYERELDDNKNSIPNKLNLRDKQPTQEIPSKTPTVVPVKMSTINEPS